MKFGLALSALLVSASGVAAQECSEPGTCTAKLTKIYSDGEKAHMRKKRLDLCEGDCDKDAHCAKGLVCFQRDGLTPVPGCEGEGEYGYDYCITPPLTGDDPKAHLKGPLGICEGDCDYDSHCGDGLICHQREGLTAVPGCAGSGTYGFSYCILPELDSSGGEAAHEKGPIGLCAGDCDNDGQCADGLVCHARDGLDLIPGCRGPGLFDYDYCVLPELDSSGGQAAHKNGPIGLCAGDCDNDGQCEEGLVCHHRPGLEPVPGCDGEGAHGFSYCVLPDLEDFGPRAHEQGPLKLCQGDCDIDAHCADDLVCFQREGHTHVPGCVGTGAHGYSYCVRPMLEDFGPRAHEQGILKMCQGDCDTDAHCDKGLKCLKRSGYDKVPGCYGIGAYDYDYCGRPAIISNGPQAHLYGELGICEGDCDIDDHCAEGLKCFQRQGLDAVPGCRGAGDYGFSYCVLE